MKRRIKISFSIAAALAVIVAALAIPFARTTPAQGAELHVMVSDGMKAVVEELTPQIERSIGRKLVIDFNSSKNLNDKIQSGQPFDAVILTSDVVDTLIKQGKIAGDSRREISRAGIGVGVRAGAPKPDISTAEAMKRALLSAKAISFNPSGASAVHNFDMLNRMGIADTVKPKLMLPPEAGRPQQYVADGKAEIVMTLIPEIQFYPGVDLVGPIPAEFQSYIKFSVGAATNTKEAEAGKALIQFMAGPAVPPVLKAKGMER